MGSLGLGVGDLAFSQSLGILLSGGWRVENSGELDTDDIADALLESLEIILYLTCLDLLFDHLLFLTLEFLPQFLL